MSTDQSPEQQAIANYTNSGDTRPTLDQLQEGLAVVTAGSMSPENMAVAADMHIDLAYAANRNEEIGAAESYLAQLAMMPSQDKAQSRQITEFAIAARLRLAELPNWRAGLRGQPLALSYGEILEAAEGIARIYREVAGSSTRLMEFMPVLLGARDLRWVGRLSLKRESSRSIEDVSINSNWSTGLVLDPVGSLMEPDRRLKVKRGGVDSGRTRGSQFRAAGVIPVSARGHGFADPLQIIMSCLHEADGTTIPSVSDIEILSNRRLNAITRQLMITVDS